MPKGLVTLNFSNLELITLHPSRTAMPKEDNHDNFVDDADEAKLCSNHSNRIQRWQQLVACSAQCLFQSPLCAPENLIWAPCKSCPVILFDFTCCEECTIVYSPCCGRFRGYVPPPWIFFFNLLSVCYLFLFILPLTWIILVCSPWPISVPPWATNTVLKRELNNTL